MNSSTATLPALPTSADSLARRAGLVAGASLLVAVAAHVSVPLPFSPIPLVLSDFAVLLVGMVLGPAAGFASLMLYLAEGAAGLPVFNPHGPGGLAQMLGPTGGFLFAYPLVAAAAGWLVRHLPLRAPLARGLAGAALASTVLFAFGATWLATLLHLRAGSAWHLAVAPFLAGAVVKVIAAALLFRTASRWQQS